LTGPCKHKAMINRKAAKAFFLRKQTAWVLLFLVLAARLHAAALVQPSPVLDAAFSLLEAGNPLLERYNRLTGSAVEAHFEYGVPYFFGGRAFDNILRVMNPWQNSRYYKKQNYYVYGFDCAGLTQWVLRQAGCPTHPGASEILENRQQYADKLLPFDGLPLNSIPLDARAGDLLVLRKPDGYHMMLYMGTLRDYGCLETGLPEPLQCYLDNPLMIHSGENHFYYDRYAAWVAKNIKITKVSLPDGGAMLSVLADTAPSPLKKARVPGETGKEVLYFDLEGYPMTVYDPSRAISSQWVRWAK
jgi:cell wall-associated NlpC family hydrolase